MPCKYCINVLCKPSLFQETELLLRDHNVMDVRVLPVSRKILPVLFAHALFQPNATFRVVSIVSLQQRVWPQMSWLSRVPERMPCLVTMGYKA